MKKIPTINELKKYEIIDLQCLAGDIRTQIIDSVKLNGGHLASNLGVVELEIALHYTFNAPYDKLIFDVGHQCYTHKILTNRAEVFSKLRKADGISGFPKSEESEFDTFNTGHSSTSLSFSAGLMRARSLQNENYKIISIIGDGAFANGEAFEALNDIATLRGNNIIIINDNNMTISKRVGGLCFDDDSLNNFFDAFGIEYFGSVNGHDLESLISTFDSVKEKQKPVVIRVVTEKGKGYLDAEVCPNKFHSFSKIKNQNEISGQFTNTFGKTLEKMVETNPNIVALTAAMTDGVGLENFAQKYPHNFIDVGIAEEHAVAMSVALAKQGLRPYVAIYSTFFQRAFDQMLIEVCLNNLPVGFCIDHSGLVEDDGETHQGIYDISYMRMLPNIKLFAPKDTAELQDLLEKSQSFDFPFAIKYPKCTIDCKSFEINKKYNDIFSKISSKNKISKIVLLTSGAFTFEMSKCVKNFFDNQSIDVELQNQTELNNFENIEFENLKDSLVVTIEDNVLKGGFGSSFDEYANANDYNIDHISVAIDDKNLKQADTMQLVELGKISPNDILKTIYNHIK